MKGIWYRTEVRLGARMKGIWYRTEVRLGGGKIYGTDRRLDLEDERYMVQIGGQTWRMKGIWYRTEVRLGARMKGIWYRTEVRLGG
jgi:hypothetical protein